MYPRDVGRPRIVSPELQWICHVTTLLFWFSETVGWTAMGRWRQQRAAGRLRWLSSEVRRVIGDGKVNETGISVVCSWLGYQIVSPLRRVTECSRGVFYLLSGGRASYTGVTSFRQPGSGAKCKVSGACPRYWEHIRDLRKNPNDHQAAARNKRRCFSRVDEAKIAILELSRGDTGLMRVVEKRLISSVSPDANTQHRTESFSLCSGRLRTCARRRPPKRFRPVSLLGACVGVSNVGLRDARSHESAKLEMIQVQTRLERICKGSRAVYRHQLEDLRLRGIVGPVNINKDIALSHVVGVTSSVPWREFYKSETFVYRAVRLVRMLKRPGIRQRIMKAFQDLLRYRGLPSITRRMISVPPEITRQICKAAVHQVWELLRTTNRERWSWIMEQSVLVNGRKRTFQDLWNAIDTCRSLESSCVVPGKKECLKGARNDDRFWKLERVRTGLAE